jgi:cytochrome c oxidase assembly protein subunit 11
MPANLKAKNRRILVGLTVVVAAMIGMSYAAVPLYDLFCRVTGFGGTTQVASAPSAKTADRVMKIRFDASLSNTMPWNFQPVQREMSLQVGKTGIAFYRAENQSKQTVVGTATFNVTPLKAGIYFSKIDCFCFKEQRLKSGEKVDMPVTFFVDPEIMKDRNLDDVDTITLSYTFFEATGSLSAVEKTDRTVN